MPITLYTKINAQRDKLETVVSLNKLPTLATFDDHGENILSPEFKTKFLKEVPSCFGENVG